MNSNAAFQSAFFKSLPQPAPVDDPMRLRLLLWAGVLLAGMLFIYVQLVLAQVARGERLREEQRARAAVVAATVIKRKPPAQTAPPVQPIKVSQYTDR